MLKDTHSLSADTEQPFAIICCSDDPKDREQVREIFKVLAGLGYNLWFDEEETSPDMHRWDNALMLALENRNCRNVLFFRSSAAMLSKGVASALERASQIEQLKGQIVTIDIWQSLDEVDKLCDNWKKGRIDPEETAGRICNIVSHDNNAIRLSANVTNAMKSFQRITKVLSPSLKKRAMFKQQELDMSELNADELYVQGNVFRDAQDFEQASEYYQMAANYGHSAAMYELGKLYLAGSGIERNEEQAYALFFLAHDMEKAYTELRKGAEQGIPAAQYQLGMRCYMGTEMLDTRGFMLHIYASEFGKKIMGDMINPNMWDLPYGFRSSDFLLEHQIENMPVDTGKPFLFVCYSHDQHDCEIVHRIFRDLSESGYNLWIDVANLPSDEYSWKTAAMEALEHENCAGLIFFRSRSALERINVAEELIASYDLEYMPNKIRIVDIWENAPRDNIRKFSKARKKGKVQSGLDAAKKIFDLVPYYTKALKLESDDKQGVDRLIQNLKEDPVLKHVRNRNVISRQADYAQAVEWFRKAAEQGYAPAQFMLGRCYYEGRGVVQNDVKAMSLYGQAANQGYAKAEEAFGSCYLKGRGVARSVSDGLHWLQRAANQGDPELQSKLGLLYWTGDGVPHNEDEAIHWLQRAAKQNHTIAQYLLGALYFNGLNFEGNCNAQRLEKAALWFRRSAEQGYVFAQHLLGMLLLAGKGVSQSYEEAAQWLQKAAKQGMPEAQTDLGILYLDGKGVSHDDEEGALWLRRAAEQEYAPAQSSLGNLYYAGKGVAQNLREAVSWFKKAAKQGDVHAQYMLGHCLFEGKGISRNTEKAVIWYKKAAEQGYPLAQYMLGYCLFNGDGIYRNTEEAFTVLAGLGDILAHGASIPLDTEEAFIKLRKVAELGDAHAQCAIGYCLLEGNGIARNTEEAVMWLRKAAEQNHVQAQCVLGHCLLEEECIFHNTEEAIIWFRKAAEKGDAYAQYMLGYLLSKGKGIVKNPKKAVIWLRKAAEQGNDQAQYALGCCLFNGEGIAKHPNRAVKWFREAAEQGNVQAQYVLGYCLLNGEGIAQNTEEAVIWLRKSADHGNDDAQSLMSNLALDEFGINGTRLFCTTQPLPSGSGHKFVGSEMLPRY